MSAENASGVGEVTPEPDQAEQGQRDRRGAGIWAVLATVLLVAIVLLLLLTRCVPRVPDVVGLTPKQAESKLSAAGYEIGDVSKLALPKVPAGKVAEQAPIAGAVFPRGRSVDLIVALGGDLVDVPDVVGNDTPAAQLELTGQQLKMVVTGMYSTTIPAGAIISQSPPAGTKVPVGTQVTVVVSLGLPPESSDSSGGGTGSSGFSGGGSGSSGSGTSSNCTASYPNASVWSSGGDIFIRLTSGGSTRRITSGSKWDTNPILSPNAKYVVFMRAPSSGAKSNQIGRVCLTNFAVAILELPISSPSSLSTIYYGKPVFGPSPKGTAPNSDWLVTPQFMTDDETSADGIGARLLVTNVPIDSTWVSWNVDFRPTPGVTLSRSSKAGSVKVSQPGRGSQNFNIYTGRYSR